VATEEQQPTNLFYEILDLYDIDRDEVARLREMGKQIKLAFDKLKSMPPLPDDVDYVIEPIYRLEPPTNA
jgi:hypothetical protein